MNPGRRWQDRLIASQMSGMLLLLFLLVLMNDLTLLNFYLTSCILFFVISLYIVYWSISTQTITRLKDLLIATGIVFTALALYAISKFIVI
jgi:hypothetical protein